MSLMVDRKKILVTGSSGQLGREIQALWKNDDNYELIFVDRILLPLDVPEHIYEILSRYNPAYIIHAAAYTAVDKAEEEPELAHKINHLATVEIAKYCRDTDCKLIFISTDYVFSGDIDNPLAEDYPTAAINVYGKTKENAEKALLIILPQAIIIRTSWVYSEYGKNFVKTMLHLMTVKEELNVVNDQIGSPTYAADLAEAIKTIIFSGKWIPGIYHYSNEGTASWFDFAVAIQQLEGFHCKINPVDSSAFPTLAHRPKYSLLAKEKIKQEYQIQIPLWQDSLKKMLDRHFHRSE